MADLFLQLINSAFDMSLKSTQGSARELVSIIGHDGIILLNRSLKNLQILVPSMTPASDVSEQDSAYHTRKCP